MTMSMKTPIASLLLAVVAACAAGGEAVPESGPVDSTDVYETRHYPVLSWPQTLWTWLVYPLGQATIHAEHEKLPKRIREWFMNESQTFGLFPYVTLGGETSTAGGAQGYLATGTHVLTAAHTVHDADRHSGSWQYSDVSGAALYWDLEADYLKTDDEGATVNGSVADRLGVLFALERADAAATVGWRSNAGPLRLYNKSLAVEGRVGWGRRDLTSRVPVTPPVTGAVGLTPHASQIAGLDEVISLFTVGVRVEYDDRDFEAPVHSLTHPLNYRFPGRLLVQHADAYLSFRDTFYPERGGLLMAEADYVTGSDETRFVRLAAEVQRFHTLFWRNRILAGRVRLERLHRIDDGVVPFPDLPHLGGSQRLRGYERGAFHGQGLLLAAVEYRYPIWDTWNAFLFHEEGQVFDEYGDIGMDRFVSSTGGGLSLRSQAGLLLGLRLAHSAEEDLLAGFTLEQEF